MKLLPLCFPLTNRVRQASPPISDSKMTEEEWNFLIAHAHRRVEQLQRRIVELEMGQKEMIESAVNLQRAKDESIFERKLLNELERQKQEFEFDKQKVVRLANFGIEEISLDPFALLYAFYLDLLD